MNLPTGEEDNYVKIMPDVWSGDLKSEINQVVESYDVDRVLEKLHKLQRKNDSINYTKACLIGYEEDIEKKRSAMKQLMQELLDLECQALVREIYLDDLQKRKPKKKGDFQLLSKLKYRRRLERLSYDVSS